jgi:hypothetical protein
MKNKESLLTAYLLTTQSICQRTGGEGTEADGFPAKERMQSLPKLKLVQYKKPV